MSFFGFGPHSSWYDDDMSEYYGGDSHLSKKDEQLPASIVNAFNTQKEPSGVTLLVRPQAKAKMDLYVRMINMEVGWMGFIREAPREHAETGLILPSQLVLEDVFLYKQEVSGGSVDAEAVDANAILQKLIENGDEDKIPQLRFFAHSHANMSVYHSPRDIEMINDWAATGLDWFISHVQNRKGEINVRFDMFQPIRVSAPVTEIEVLDTDLLARVNAEIEENVSQRTYTYSKTKSGASSSDRPQNASGRIYSDEATEQIENPKKRFAVTMGTVEYPQVRYTDMWITYNYTNGTRSVKEKVRQEIVKGYIIHESVDGTLAAKQRINMSHKERWDFYNAWLKKNDLVEDPTTGEITQVQILLEETTNDQVELSQTPDPKSHKNDSKSEKQDAKDADSNKNSGKKKEKELKEQEQLAVSEEEASTDEKVTTSEDVEKQVREHLEKAGL